MLRRLASRAIIALAALLLVATALLLRPRDVIELIAGLALNVRLGVVQLALLCAATALLAIPTRHARRLRRGMLGAAALIAIAVLARDHARIARDTIALDAEGTRLAATVYTPRGVDRVRQPAVLLLHGSGPSRRAAYEWLARRFVERGFVVLNVDKRGVGGSAGRYTGDDLARGVIERRAADARPALAYLTRRADVDTARIGLVAISQGGWVVPLLLGGDSPARYAINISGSAVSSGEEGLWSEWTNERGDHFGFRPPPAPFDTLDARLQRARPSDFDPRVALDRMRFPSLWLYGAWDASQPSAASVRVLDSARARGVNITSTTFADANHGLMVVRGPNGRRFPNFASGVWDTVFAWSARIGVVAVSAR